MSQGGLGDYSFSTNERRDSEGLLYMGRPSCPHCKVLLCYKTSRSFFGGTQETWRPPKWFSGKESACQCRRCLFDPWVGKKIPGRRKWQPTLVFLPGESQGQRSLEGHGVGHNWSDFAAAAAAYTGGKKNTSQHTISCHRFSEILIQAWSLPLINYLFLLFNVGGFQGGEFSNLLTL